MKLFSVKESKNINGKKTTINITTEDPQIIKNLLDSVPGDKEQKKASGKKDSNKTKVKEVNPKAKKEANKKATKTKALPAPKAKPKTSTSKGASKKNTVAKNSSDTGFVPKDETIIFHKGKWIITKKPIGGLFTYSLYEKDCCRTQLIFMPDDDKKALNEFKKNIREEFF